MRRAVPVCSCVFPAGRAEVPGLGVAVGKSLPRYFVVVWDIVDSPGDSFSTLNCLNYCVCIHYERNGD